MERPSPRVWWGRLALRWKTLLVTGIPVLVLTLAVPLLFVAQQASSRVSQDVEEAYRVRQRLAQLLQGLVDAETGVRGFLLTGDEAFLGTFDSGVATVPHDLSALADLLQDARPHLRDDLADLRALVDERVRILGRTRAFADRTPVGTIPDDLLAQGRAAMDDVRASVGRLDAAETDVLRLAKERLETAEEMTFVLSVVVVPLAMLLTLLVTLRYTAGIVRRVRRIEENAQRMERGEPLVDPPRGSDELASLGQALAHTAARLAEQDAELRELALEDPLTGLRNRRAFLQIAQHELQVAARRTSVTVLLFMDVDGLKEVNDRLGHAVGDEMLREFADVLTEELRAADLIARIGGDEFCVLLSRDSAMDGTDVLERLEEAVARRNREPGRRYALAFSTGAAFFDPADPVPIDDLIAQADAVMYEEKRRKRAGRVAAG